MFMPKNVHINFYAFWICFGVFAGALMKSLLMRHRVLACIGLAIVFFVLQSRERERKSKKEMLQTKFDKLFSEDNREGALELLLYHLAEIDPEMWEMSKKFIESKRFN
jgi:hypothetical protein